MMDGPGGTPSDPGSGTRQVIFQTGQKNRTDPKAGGDNATCRPQPPGFSTARLARGRWAKRALQGSQSPEAGVRGCWAGQSTQLAQEHWQGKSRLRTDLATTLTGQEPHVAPRALGLKSLLH